MPPVRINHTRVIRSLRPARGDTAQDATGLNLRWSGLGIGSTRCCPSARHLLGTGRDRARARAHGCDLRWFDRSPGPSVPLRTVPGSPGGCLLSSFRNIAGAHTRPGSDSAGWVDTGVAGVRRPRGAITDRMSCGADCPSAPLQYRTASPVARASNSLELWRNDSEQADFPAEQPPPGQDPRFPPADAHPRRPRNPGSAAPQGPRSPVGLSAQRSPAPRVCGHVPPASFPGLLPGDADGSACRNDLPGRSPRNRLR